MKAIGILAAIMLLALTPGPGAFAQPGPPPGGGGFIEHWDQNGDGVVTEDEFGGPANHFAEFDRNGDGSIDESEAPQGPPPGMRMGKHGNFMNQDQDQDGKVSREEFRGPEDLFDQLDADGSGYIEESEKPKGPPQGPPPRQSMRLYPFDGQTGMVGQGPQGPGQRPQGFNAGNQPNFQQTPPMGQASRPQGPPPMPGFGPPEFMGMNRPGYQAGPPMVQGGPPAFGPPPLPGPGYQRPCGCPPGPVQTFNPAYRPLPGSPREAPPAPVSLSIHHDMSATS